jgi:hypothetical protein
MIRYCVGGSTRGNILDHSPVPFETMISFSFWKRRESCVYIHVEILGLTLGNSATVFRKVVPQEPPRCAPTVLEKYQQNRRIHSLIHEQEKG